MRFSPEDYAELRGLYLGDGAISKHPRTSRLRITLDIRYPQIIGDTRELLERCFRGNAVHVGMYATAGKCVSISVYSTHLTCLFPRHRPGAKQSRPIVLEPWQRRIIDAAPWDFVRGCIRSDGCAFINRTGPYEYLSYDFSNTSEDIARLFLEACDRLNLRPRVSRNPRGLWRIRINRRESVARLMEHVGCKA